MQIFFVVIVICLSNTLNLLLDLSLVWWFRPLNFKLSFLPNLVEKNNYINMLQLYIQFMLFFFYTALGNKMIKVFLA